MLILTAPPLSFPYTPTCYQLYGKEKAIKNIDFQKVRADNVSEVRNALGKISNLQREIQAIQLILLLCSV